MHEEKWESRVEHEVYGLGRLSNSGQGLEVGWGERDDAGVLQDEPPLHRSTGTLHTLLHVVGPRCSDLCLTVFPAKGYKGEFSIQWSIILVLL